ncbi:sensor histidine kinase [Streptomyces antimicrobicus]|uniref:histidine kinase n=1 Tax=Streptomyces antimicrobicus TaxID=2883108 RepID=A0ABS8B0A0_9ACTN|nr:histidine kinase [Streptomyces antimicrobicus]MCB5178028.1 histidine kinase [Streptomyces antimicrobicus]
MTSIPRTACAPALAVGAVLLLVGSTLGLPAPWTLLGVLALLPLIAVVARWAPAPWAWAAGGLAGAAVAYWPVSLLRGAGSSSLLEVVGAGLFWALAAGGAAGAGWFLRRQADLRVRAVRDARREQQLELARDLHDFVAHDVSAIVVQAQAARFVADGDPQQAVRALERIEAAGLSALASMDRTVHALRAAGGGPTSPTPGLEALPELVERFEAGELEADAEAMAGLSREAGTTAYRVAVEALTNVRRHAHGAARVRVVVRRTAGGTELSVVNDAPPRGPRRGPLRRRVSGGTGLAGLRARVEAAGGVLSAGPREVGGWQVSAVFPHGGPCRT